MTRRPPAKTAGRKGAPKRADRKSAGKTPAASRARSKARRPPARPKGAAPSPPGETSLPVSLYPRESLVAAAAALGERASVGLEQAGKRWRLSVEPAALLGEFLNDALSHARRQARIAEARAEAAAVVARLLEKGFPAAPADPLEQLEPQVRLDRAEETAQLLAKAAKLAAAPGGDA